MRNIKYIIFGWIFLALFASCEDKFSQVKEINFPEHESKLAITSQMSTPLPNPSLDIVPSVFVGNSLGILDQSEFDRIDDATIDFYKDGVELFDFTYDPDNNIYLGPDNAQLSSGTYTLEVSAPGYDMVSATQTMPSPAQVISSTYEFEKVPYDFDDDLYDLLKLKIKDPAGEENYYVFELFYEIKDPNTGEVYQNNTYTESDNPFFEDGYNSGPILPDINFNGENYDVRLLLQSEWWVQDLDDLVAIIVDVYSVSKDFYYYETSRSRFYDAEDNPFAEPVLVHSNVEGGYGVFTLSNIIRYRHEF